MPARSPLRALVLLGAFLLLLASEPAAQARPRGARQLPVAAGPRLLSMSITDSANGTFDDWVGTAKKAGASATSLPVFWDELETSPGVFAPSPDWLAIANAYYPAQGMRLFLGIHPIDTNQLRMPPDLAGRAFDDPVVIARFGALLDWAVPRVAAVDLLGISIGNEVDATLGADPSAWAAYRTFAAAAIARVHALRPGVPVGVKVTYEGLTKTAPSLAASLNGLTDQVLTTYYPLRPDFTVRPPRVFRGDMNRLAARYPGRKIVLAEIGYPSGALVGGSEAKQAAFVGEVFAYWDHHRARFPWMEWVWLHDLSPAAKNALGSYYGIADPRFLDYLGSLGLRRYGGAAKPAYRALRHAATVRGF